MTYCTKESTVEVATETILKKWKENEGDPFRPVYHPIAPHGWLNDPNGLIYFEGWYHVFYQWNPYGNNWGNMHWGHMRSQNLHDWEHLPVALAPEAFYERDGCFSGSALAINEEMVLFYTANIFEAGKHPYNDGPLAIQTQAIAVSQDGGVTFKKSQSNPVLKSPPEGGTCIDFRDPKVFEKQDHYMMVLGSRQRNRGELVVYRTPDKGKLDEWVYNGQLAMADESLGYMWECPDCIEIRGQEMFIVSPMGAKAYEDKNVSGYMSQGAFHRMDQMPNFYAPQTFSGLKTPTLLGWITMPQLDLEKHNWNGCLTLPRRLDVSDSGLLTSEPCVPQSAYGPVLFRAYEKNLQPESLIELKGDVVHLQLTLSRAQIGRLRVKLKSDDAGKHYTGLVLDLKEKRIVLDARPSGEMVRNKEVDRHCSYSYKDLDYDHDCTDQIDLGIYIDKSVIEIYALEGLCLMTTAVFSDPGHNKIFISASGDHEIELESVELRQMKPSKHFKHPALKKVEEDYEKERAVHR